MTPQERKETPVFRGVLQYFPNALKYVSRVSLAGNRQHHPDKPLHWDKNKSTDEADALTRHLIDMGEDGTHVDSDGILHAGKVAWRGLANLERVLDRIGNPQAHTPTTPETRYNTVGSTLSRPIYISGKITDETPEKVRANLARFNEVEERLRPRGCEIINPAKLETPGATWEWYLARDLHMIYNRRPSLYLLRGWRESRGARLEYETALLLQLPIEEE